MCRLARLTTAAALLAATAGCSPSSGDDGAAAERRVLVLGIDGMDPVLLGELMAAGRMPAFSRVAAAGSFKALTTSDPAQSPVAWSNFISGASPGTHQIFDFIHRDPSPGGTGRAVAPYLSTSKVEPARRDWSIGAGPWRIPLFGSRPVTLRRGGAFWDDLVAGSVKTVIYRLPANYPPPPQEGVSCICGMGTPDLLGTYGEFTFYTPDAPAGGRQVSGGRFVRLRMDDHRGTATLTGPGNFLRKPDERGAVPDLEVVFEVVRDPRADVAKISIGDELVLLNGGEWSDWVPVAFETGIPASAVLEAMQLPTSAPAMVRFYLKAVHPRLELYVTPINIDPLRPATAIGAPADFPRDVAKACGRFYTTGIPEDTKGLRSGALTEDEFLAQVEVLKAERIAQYRLALEQFDQGFLFFYFGHTDQLSHIFWRDRDPQHPAHDPAEARRYGSVIEDAYVEMDGLVGEAMAVLDDDDTLIIMSDHGFTSFRRGFHLNSWLIERGYLVATNPLWRDRQSYLEGVDWTRTQAYGLGLNALYLNQAGRESGGIVQAPEERRRLLTEITEALLEVRDSDGSRVVETVTRVEDVYPGADPALAPDLLVGYAANYRASWATAEGAMPYALFEDNHDRWSGDHCIAPHLVPGILVTNRTVLVDDPDLTDLAPTILSVYGVDPAPHMTGRVLFAEPERLASGRLGGR